MINRADKINWHTLTADKVVKMLKTDAGQGLSHADVQKRLAEYGKNAFTHERGGTFLARLVSQFKSPLVFVLLAAGTATLFLGEVVNTIVIFLALAVNVGIGFFQESRASQAFLKLASSQERTATVIRDGKKHVVDAAELVPGDILEIHSGAQVPADVHLLRARELSVNEAPLTGESLPVEKKVEIVGHDKQITEQHNMAWMGTLVASGDGRGVVVATGDDTEIGKIAGGLTEEEEVLTPVQRSIRRLAHFLSFLILTIVLIIFALGVVRGEDIETMLLLAIAVAVSVIPEGLPAAVTAVLAIGMEKILSRGGLVRNLLAAETLGSTTVILTDKTGTLTHARMRLFLFITGSGESQGKLSPDARRLLAVGLYATDAFIETAGDGKEVVRGRPIERAIVERALEEGMREDDLVRTAPQKDFLLFASENRFAASLNTHNEHGLPAARLRLPVRGTQTDAPRGQATSAAQAGGILYVSGAPGTLLDASTRVLRDGEVVELTDEDRERFRSQLEQYAQNGVRFIAVGYRPTQLRHIPEVDAGSAPDLLEGLVFGGLFGFEDSIREDVPSAIRKAQSAGAHIIMLTGDNPETARSVAAQAGIVSGSAPALRGTDVEKLTDAELRKTLKNTQVFARVLPHQKLRIVKLLQKEGEIIAMTGDGINDAPALKRADIGVAVGSGTEVAQEASDLVLLNDSFSIIVAAIEEGRRIIDNLKKVISHLLSTHFHEVFVVTTAVLLGLPIPILPAQILWVNILQEGLLTFAFAFEPPEKGLMRRDPREESARNILTKHVKQLILIAGIITGVFSVVLFLTMLFVLGLPIEEIRTVVFVMLLLDAILFAVSLKQLRRPFWYGKLFNNKYLLVALGVSVVGAVVTLSFPPLREFLSLTVLTPLEMLILFGVAVFNLLTIEVTKLFVFRGQKTVSQ